MTSDTMNIDLLEEILFIDQTIHLAVAEDNKYLYLCAQNAFETLAESIKPANILPQNKMQKPVYSDPIDELFAPKPVVQVVGQARKLSNAERYLCEYMRLIEASLNTSDSNHPIQELNDLLDYLGDWEDSAIFREHYHSNTVLQGNLLIADKLNTSRKQGINSEFKRAMLTYADDAARNYKSGKSTGFTDMFNTFD